MSTLSIDISCQFGGFLFSLKQDLKLKGITGIYGHSGSGKSTLLRIIAGLNNQATGTINFNDTVLLDTGLQDKKSLPDTNLNSKSKRGTQTFIQPQARNFSLVFQDNRLFPHLNVKENLVFAAKRCAHSKLKISEILKLTELELLAESSVTTLSGGEQQRVALARAILTEPKLLLLDEPLSALDQNSKNVLLKMLINIQKKLDLPMFYVSHSLDELQQIADNILVLSKGEVVDYGDIHQIIHKLNYADTDSDSNQLIMHQQTSLALPLKVNNNQPEENHGLNTLLLNDLQEIHFPAHLIKERSANKQFITTNALNEPVKLRFFILASDISLCLETTNNSSIVNHLHGVISKIDCSNNNVLITIDCAGQRFFANISSYSLDKLSLKVDQAIYMQFKASAVRTFIN